MKSAVSPSSSSFGGNESRAGAEERINHDAAGQRPRLPSSTLLTCGAVPFLNRGGSSCCDRLFSLLSALRGQVWRLLWTRR
jgi:hypothetical protein